MPQTLSVPNMFANGADITMKQAVVDEILTARVDEKLGFDHRQTLKEPQSEFTDIFLSTIRRIVINNLKSQKL